MSKKAFRNVILAVAAIGVCVAVVIIMKGNYFKSGGGGADSARSAVFSKFMVESTVYFYFADRKSEYLTAEERLFSHPETPVEFAKMIVDGLIKGPQRGGIRTVPAETALKAFYMTKEGTAVADFTKEMSDKHPGGARTEYLTIMSLTNSLVMNIPDIKRVKILIDGKEAETLAGHIDLSEPFYASMELVR